MCGMSVNSAMYLCYSEGDENYIMLVLVLCPLIQSESEYTNNECGKKNPAHNPAYRVLVKLYPDAPKRFPRSTMTREGHCIAYIEK